MPHEALIDIYFSRFHDKPFHIFDESTFRQRLQLNQLPNYLLHALYAVAARCAPHPDGFQAAAKLSEQYSAQARREIDTDEPSVDALQALILLVTAFTAQGKGKKAYMLLSTGYPSSVNGIGANLFHSQRRWYGQGSGAAQGTRHQCARYFYRTRNTTAAVLDMLLAG